jgi:hypothetical protein
MLFCEQNKKWWEPFLVHEIGRIDGGKVFQNSGNMLQFSGNIFYNRKNKILIKILAGKRSVIRIIMEFHGIPSGFPNQGLISLALPITCLASDLGQVHQMYDCMVQCIIGLRHSPSLMKNQHGLNEEKTLNKEKRSLN